MRITNAIARAEFSDVANEKLDRAFGLSKESIKAWD